MKLSTRVRPFSGQSFGEEVAKAARPHSKEWEQPPQARYLATYLADRELGARTMIVEEPYVDRHYLQEYVGHYATTLRPVPSTTTRIHFLRRTLDDAGWSALVRKASTCLEELSEVERTLEQDYLGYVVVRPLASCPIGRTVLSTYPSGTARRYQPASTVHVVHLHGLTLRVAALPFQQQDRALGACATTAVWSALARVMRADGGRAATPLEVARAVPGVYGQLVAAPDGLDAEQMRGAIRALGYDAHSLGPADHDEFLLAVKAYVIAGIPVVLRLRMNDGQVHAVTVAGLRLEDEEMLAKDLVLKVGEHTARSTGLTRLYLHDDRLGPYARFVFVPPTDCEQRLAAKHGYPLPLKIRFDPQKPGFEKYGEPARVEMALVPLYPKIRTTARGLTTCAAEYLPLVCGIAGPRRDELRIDLFYALGGLYLREGLPRVLREPERLAHLRRTAFLSRYVGVLRFSLGPDWLLDLVVDTTDVQRARVEATPLLMAAASSDDVLASLQALAAEHDDVLVS